jgi:cystathionine beta-lyase/cystathionine gamma-synthase
VPLRIVERATSLGGIESLIEHRASIEGEGSLSRRSAQAVRGARRCRRTLSRSDQSALGRR